MVMGSVSEGNGLRIKHKMHSEKLIFHKKKIPKTSNAHIQTSKQSIGIRRKLIQPCEKKRTVRLSKTYLCCYSPFGLLSSGTENPSPTSSFFLSRYLFFFFVFCHPAKKPSQAILFLPFSFTQKPKNSSPISLKAAQNGSLIHRFSLTSNHYWLPKNDSFSGWQ